MNIGKDKNIELEIINLSKKFGNKVVFRNLNIQIPKGKSVGIMGPSGTGKSVLLKCILELMQPYCIPKELRYREKLKGRKALKL